MSVSIAARPRHAASAGRAVTLNHHHHQAAQYQAVRSGDAVDAVAKPGDATTPRSRPSPRVSLGAQAALRPATARRLTACPGENRRRSAMLFILPVEYATTSGDCATVHTGHSRALAVNPTVCRTLLMLRQIHARSGQLSRNRHRHPGTSAPGATPPVTADGPRATRCCPSRPPQLQLCHRDRGPQPSWCWYHRDYDAASEMQQLVNELARLVAPATIRAVASTKRSACSSCALPQRAARRGGPCAAARKILSPFRRRDLPVRVVVRKLGLRSSIRAAIAVPLDTTLDATQGTGPATPGKSVGTGVR